ncbi:unnamed protein product, partial [Closterium sp. NIES-53]
CGGGRKGGTRVLWRTAENRTEPTLCTPDSSTSSACSPAGHQPPCASLPQMPPG